MDGQSGQACELVSHSKVGGAADPDETSRITQQ